MTKAKDGGSPKTLEHISFITWTFLLNAYLCKEQMTTKQLISEINKVLNQVPDSALNTVLDYLNSLKGKSEEEIQRASYLRKILEEDKALLERLAK